MLEDDDATGLSDRMWTYDWKFRDTYFLLCCLMGLMGFVAPEHRRRAMNLVLATFGITIVPAGDGAVERELLLDWLTIAIEDTNADNYPYDLIDADADDAYLAGGIEELTFTAD
jgi:hypothetical protein